MGLIRVVGLVAWYLLVLDVVIGMTLSGNVAKVVFPRQHRYRVHIAVSWLMVLAITLHVTLLVSLHYHGWTAVDVEDVRWSYTLAHNAGILTLWLLAVLLVTLIAEKLIARPTRLVLHRTVPFLILVLATLHATFAAPDARSLPILVPAVVALTYLSAVGIVRYSQTRARARTRSIRMKGHP